MKHSIYEIRKITEYIARNQNIQWKGQRGSTKPKAASLKTNQGDKLLAKCSRKRK